MAANEHAPASPQRSGNWSLQFVPSGESIMSSMKLTSWKKSKKTENVVVKKGRTRSSSDPPPTNTDPETVGACTGAESNSQKFNKATAKRKKAKEEEQLETGENSSEKLSQTWKNPASYKELDEKTQKMLVERGIDIASLSDDRSWRALLHILRFLKVECNVVDYTKERTATRFKFTRDLEKELFDENKPGDKTIDWIKQGKTLGQGGFGRVFLGKIVNKVYAKKLKVKSVAVKVMPYDETREKRNALVELKFLRLCKHPNIVELHSAYIIGKESWFVMEQMEGGTLSQAASEFRFAPRHVAYTARELLYALEFL